MVTGERLAKTMAVQKGRTAMNRRKRFFQYLGMGLCLAMVAGCALDNVQTKQGEASFLYKRGKWYRAASTYGTQVGPTSTGWCWKVDEITFPITQHPYREKFTIMVEDDIPLTFEASVTLKPNTDEESIQELVLGWGVEYYERVVHQAFRTTVHAVVGERNSREVKTVREALAQEIRTELQKRLEVYEEQLKSMDPKVYKKVPFQIVSVNIDNLDYPKEIQETIAKTRELEKELERKATEKEIAEKNVAREIDRAKSIAERMKTLSEGMDEKYLEHFGIEVAKQLTQSDNRTVVILPTKPGAPAVPYLSFPGGSELAARKSEP